MEKITIGIFNDSFFPWADGVISVVDNYAKRLVKYANVIVFVPRYKNMEFDDTTLPYKVVRCKSIKFSNIEYFIPTPDIDIEFEKELKKYKLDIVHIHSPYFIGRNGIRYAKKHNIPVVATMHSQFKQDYERFIKNEKICMMLTHKLIREFNKCDECWAVNSEVARIFYEEYGYKEMPRVMNNATEMLPVKDSNKSIDRINKLHNINKDDKVFLFVGRLNILKNILFIVDSLKRVEELKTKFTWKMIFIGYGQDEDVLKNKIKDLNLEDNIILTGKVTDRNLLADYYARGDLFLFPSLYDASSIVQIEAASQKTPGLFLEEAATAATIKNNHNGFLAKNNIDDYANRIIEIMDNTKLYSEVKENAFKEIYKNWDDVIDEVYQLYLKLMEKYNDKI